MIGAGDAADSSVASEPLSPAGAEQGVTNSTDSCRVGWGHSASATPVGPPEFVVSSMDSVTLETAHVWPPARVSSCNECVVILAFQNSIFSRYVRIVTIELENKPSGERNSDVDTVFSPSPKPCSG